MDPYVEKYDPKIKYIKDPDNDAADSLSRLPLINSDAIESNISRKYLSECYCVDKLNSDTLPPTYQTLDKYKLKDKNMVEK